jgi:Pyruvate/2-oxoacid:ferredoxin oxidoreductase delta subunit/coenzyme F420-reducing hydrogenase delta subunit
MNALIAGKSEINDFAREYFASLGFGAITAEDAADIAKFEGEAGNFSATVGGEEIGVSFVLLTEPPACEPDAIDGGAPLGLFAISPDEMEAAPRKYPDVFLLDYFRESPAYATLRAMCAAIRLSARKRRVYYLSRFARTADYESESLYAEARNAGVIFIKYDGIKITRSGGVFQIAADDGASTREISSNRIYSDGTREVGDRYRALTRAFRLRPDKDGLLVGDRHFLAPSRTSRRGVYHIGRDAALYPDEALSFIARDARRDMADLREDTARAEVNGSKCVLCYTCWRICPHAAMTPDIASRAMKNLAFACEGCGSCASACPCAAIALTGENGSAAPRGAENKTLIMCCENSAAEAMDEALAILGDLAANVEILPVPCGGRISLEDMCEALESYGGVMAAVCADGACKSFDGAKLACLQANGLAGMLELAGLSGADVAAVQISHAAPRELAEAAADFITRRERPQSKLESAP